MKHTNQIAKKVLRKHFSDYEKNQWHYDEQYKMIIYALYEFKKLNKSDVIKSVCKHEWKEIHSGYISYCVKCNETM